MSHEKWISALEAFDRFRDGDLTVRIKQLEDQLCQCTGANCADYLARQDIAAPLFQSAYAIKKAAAQINVAVHAIGILLALPYILRANERIVKLSLGAGNTGKPFDLETDQRIAEFKFITWQGGPEVIRQNALFKDFYELAEYEHPTNPSIEREMYVTGLDHPRKFFRSQRSLQSVMSRNSKLWENFKRRHQQKFATVREYYEAEGHKVRLKDLTKEVSVLFESIDWASSEP